MTFTVKTQSFEGPLDLLLELIEKRKMFINDVALATVTDDFIAHIRRFDVLPMSESAHFILIASTLLLIKSKSLLPDLSLSEEEQGDIRNLELRLQIYKSIKDASKMVEQLFDAQQIYSCSHERINLAIFAPDQNFNLSTSCAIMLDLLKRLPKIESLPKVTVKKIISLDDMINDLTKRITGQLRMSFSQFTAKHRTERVNVIVSFLAMLELVKQGVLQVSQSEHFADIEMETKQVGVPTY